MRRTGSQERTLAGQLSGAFTLFGVIVAVAFVLTALAYGLSSGVLTPELERSRVATASANAAHVAMLDQESGIRAYLLTPDTDYISHYTRAKSDLARANAALTGSIGSVPELATAMLNMRLAQERWHERWADAAAESRPDARPPQMPDGKQLFDAYRIEQAAFAGALAAYGDGLSRREHTVVAARVLFELAVFVAILLFAVHQHGALHVAIVQPVAGLLSHIRRIRDGALEEIPPQGGPLELAELAAGLNEMVRAIAAARAASESRDELVRDHSVRLRQILDASREFSESLNLSYVVRAVRESTAAVGGYDRVIVWLMDDEQKRLVLAEANADEVMAETTLLVGRSLADRAAKAGRVTFEGAKGEVRFGDSNSGAVRAIAIPLIVGARVVGALEARHNEAQVPTSRVIEVLETLATHAATAIESARLHEVIEERSEMDALTRLFNRRRLEEDLDAECKRCMRYQRPLAFVMLDVDNFKAFNDTHGHPKADTALQDVASVISGCVRTTDTAYRYGGEEFCILLRETSAQDAMHFAERVRLRIEQRFASAEATGIITASFGVAGFSADMPSPRALVEAADAAMYESKHAGRNRVALSTNPPFGGGISVAPRPS